MAKVDELLLEEFHDSPDMPTKLADMHANGRLPPAYYNLPTVREHGNTVQGHQEAHSGKLPADPPEVGDKAPAFGPES